MSINAIRQSFWVASDLLQPDWRKCWAPVIVTNRQVSRSMPVGWDSSCIRRPFDDLGCVFDDLGTCLLTIWGGRASGFKMPEISTSMSSTNLAVSTISLITPWLNCENDPNYNHASQLIILIPSFPLSSLSKVLQCHGWMDRDRQVVVDGVDRVPWPGVWTRGSHWFKYKYGTDKDQSWQQVQNLFIKVDKFAPFI